MQKSLPAPKRANLANLSVLPQDPYKFLPFDQQPLMGWQITEDNFFTITAPQELMAESFQLNEVYTAEKEYVSPRTPLFNYAYNGSSVKDLRSPIKIKVISHYDPEITAEHGDIMTVRADRPIVGSDRFELQKLLWGNDLLFLENLKKNLEKI